MVPKNSASSAAETWAWTGAYLLFGLTCLATAWLADPVSIHFAFIGSALALSALVWIAPLKIKDSMARGGQIHDLLRRASIMPVFYLAWRFGHETGLFDRRPL